MPLISIKADQSEYQIDFPFTPYQSQLVMMEKILLALSQRQNALLESPTGTGKTLCLLCASLAFASHNNNNNNSNDNNGNDTLAVNDEFEGGERRVGDFGDTKSEKHVLRNDAQARDSNDNNTNNSNDTKKKITIVYVSRTHSQLQQVMKELKRSSYRPRAAIVGSRKQLCVDEKVQEGAGKLGENTRGMEKLCKIACESGRCGKKKNVEKYVEDMYGISSSIEDVLGDLGGRGAGDISNNNSRKDSRGQGQKKTTTMMPRDKGGNNTNEKKKIMDIEDLVKEGKRSGGPCPYFLAREMTRGAELIFAPYSYILDASVRRRTLGESVINWHNSIVIFDEAHNAESACEEAASTDLTAVHIANAIKDADGAFQYYSMVEEGLAGLSKEEQKEAQKGSTMPTRDAADYLTLRGIFAALEREIAIVVAQDKERARKGETLPSSRDGWFIFDILGKVNINADTYGQIVQVCDDASTLLSIRAEEVGKGSGAGLERVKDFLDRAFTARQKGLIECYRSRVGPPEEEFSSWNANGNNDKDGKNALAALQKGPTMSFWCMVPGVIVNELCELGVKSLLLASGTLSPMDSFASELRAPFPVRLENPHVIPQENVWAGAFLKGPSNTVALNSSYRFRDTEQYKHELGLLVLRVAQVTPDGVLVFFPSYGVMAKCIQFWKTNTSIWNEIMKTTKKTLIVEPKGSEEFLEAFEAFNKALEKKKTSWSKVGVSSEEQAKAQGGAMFFAVCRGKVSEGIDFADKAGRAVILTGIPYAPKASARVRYKREFLDAAVQAQRNSSNNNNGISITTGEQWYSQTAMRATNQALGRVIRHKDDFGAVILADERFAYRNHQNQLSLWLRPAMQTFETFDRGIQSLEAFFDRCGNPNGALMLAAAAKSAKKKRIQDDTQQQQNRISNNNTDASKRDGNDVPHVKRARTIDFSIPLDIMAALQNNISENDGDQNGDDAAFLGRYGGGGGGGGGGAQSLASRLLKAGGNATKKSNKNGGDSNTNNTNNTNNSAVDKLTLAKQKLVKRARAELPPEDFPKFIEAMKNTLSSDSSESVLSESLKTLAKLCKIDKRGVGPSTLWAALGNGLTFKEAVKKAYDIEGENAKQKLEERNKEATAAVTTATSSIVAAAIPQQPLPVIALAPSYSGLGRVPKNSSKQAVATATEITTTTTTTTTNKKSTSCAHCKSAKCARPFASSVCSHFACYACLMEIFANSSNCEGRCPTCSVLITKKSLTKHYF